MNMCDKGELKPILLMKDDMKRTIDSIHSDNIAACFQVLSSQFEALKQLYAIASLQIDAGLLHVTDQQSAPLDDSYAQDTKVSNMYKVERKLRGAFVPDIEGYIPEAVVRMKNIEHGDYVYAKPIASHKAGQKRFEYELAKKSSETAPSGRIEYRACPVEKDGHMLVVNKSSVTGEMIRVNDAPYSVLIRDSDIQQFDLQEGDVVDIAFYQNNPSTATIVWKYDVSDHVTEFCRQTERKKTSRLKSDRQMTDQPEEIEQVFAGRTICVVGDKPNEAAYKCLIEERGGHHIHVEPKWNPSRIEHCVKKSDIVIGLYDVSSHTGLEKTKEYCKRYDIPFEMISGRGKSKVIQTAIDLLNTPALS